MVLTLSLQLNNNIGIEFRQKDLKIPVQEISTHLNEDLKSYVGAVGEKYFKGGYEPIYVNIMPIEKPSVVKEGKLGHVKLK